MDSFAFCVIIGFVSGIISSMGFGGGSILILILTGFLSVPQIKAQGINLLYFIPVAAVSLIFHFKNHTIDKKAAQTAILWGVIGAGAGAFAANYLNDTIPLKKIFAILVLLLGLRELLKPKEEKSQKAN